MSNDQEKGLRILDNALWRIAHRGDCEYFDDEENRPKPCDCAHCQAVAALEAAKNWRFYGSQWKRVGDGHFPREAKMHAAWMKLATTVGGGGPDNLLAKVLGEETVPSARDWYVATSVIQWLATNVGITVLEAAGFKYQQYEQDGANSELFHRRQQYEQDRVDSELLRQRQESCKETVKP